MTESKTTNHFRLELPAELRPYQQEGVAFLVERSSALLADQMGLGKTVQAVVALQILNLQQGWFRSLVICPASLRLNWEHELNRWVPRLVVRRVEGNSNEREMLYRLPIQVLIASYDQIRVDARRLHSKVSFNLILLDEAQRIKNIASETNLACRLLPRKRAWAFTGTPIENKPDEMVAIFRVLDSNLLQKGMTRPEIHSRISDYFLRRTKQQVLKSLPPIQDQEIEIDLTGHQREAYLEVWRSRYQLSSTKGSRASAAGLFAMITKLKQLCNYDPKSGESAKFEVLQTLIEGLSESDDKILVFSQYVRTLKWLSERIELPHALFYGELSEFEKAQIVNDFNHKEGPRVLLISLKAGGIGLNIHSASTVVLFDRWWNPAVEQQAIERAHRFGREKPLYVVKFLVVDTVEEKIVEILERKRRMFSEYVDGAPIAEVGELTLQDLYAILRL